jgi:hypothetical protein
MLRCDSQSQVVDHRGYDNHIEQRQQPYAGS